jgi:LAO/AO transport system kinase
LSHDLEMLSPEEMVKRVVAGDSSALARLISLFEQSVSETLSLRAALHPHLRGAHVVGFTGTPGSGKSTLIARLTAIYRKADKSVGVLAVDPTSPYSGGAVLGDRIRMNEHATDRNVFIRSLATRGDLGGVPRIVKSAKRAMDVAGLDPILIETAGVGQTELAVMDAVDTVVAVLVPGGGDGIQMLKAGLLEIADIFVVNKSDQPGAEAVAAELELMLNLGNNPKGENRPQVILTSAYNDEGTVLVAEAIAQHFQGQSESSYLADRRQEQRRKEFLEATRDGLMAFVERRLRSEEELSAVLAGVERGEQDPIKAAFDFLSDMRLV